MKIRRCFVSNSSSSSFIILLNTLSETQRTAFDEELSDLYDRWDEFEKHPEDDAVDAEIFYESFNIDEKKLTTEIEVGYSGFEQIQDILNSIGLEHQEHYEIGG